MKVVCLISGGIDSPVAAQIAVNNGFYPFLLHYHNYPFHSPGTLEKVVSLSNLFAQKNPEVSSSLSIMSQGRSQEAILNFLKRNEINKTCLFCRMQMFIKAEAFAKKINADAIITGEILGEQASQTLNNLPIVISNVTSIILRPLIGYNKEEVVKLSKKWGYYEASILPGGCCTINPRYPETKGNLEDIKKIFNRISNNLEKAKLMELEETRTYSLPTRLETILEDFEQFL